MSKILLVSDHPDLQSGYGIIFDHIANYLIAQGHEIAYIGWHHRPGLAKKSYKIYTVTRKEDKWGVNIFPAAIDEFRPDIVLTTGDIWMCYHIALFKSRDSFQSVWLAPIDSEGMVPTIAHAGGKPIPVQTAMRLFNHIVAQTEFGRAEINKFLGTDACTEVMYPGYDSETIFPVSESEKRKAKKILTGSEDTFLVLYISRNGSRKNPIGAMEAFALADIPNSKMYFHCHHHEPQGFNLNEAAKALGIENKVILSSVPVGAGVSRSVLNKLYNAADVHLLLSVREGFGLTFLESAAVGTPSIFTNANCVKEFGQRIGIGVKPVATLHEPITHSVMQIPDVKEAARALKRLWENKRGLGERLGQSTVAFAKQYTWEKVLPRWGALISSVDTTKNAPYLSPHEKTKRSFPLIVKPPYEKLAMVSTWNERCGIARYTRKLVERFSTKPLILAPDTSEGSSDGFEAIKCWSRNKETLQELYGAIRSRGITMVHFQSDWAFTMANIATYLALFEQLRASGIKTLMTFHTMPTNSTDPMAKSFARRTADLLHPMHAGIVHNEDFLHVMETLEPVVAKRIHVINHGVEIFNDPVEKEKIFTCISSGFAHQSKGFEYCVDASRELSMPHKMIIQTSVHPLDTGGQRAYVDNLLEKAEDAPSVQVINKYTTDREVSEAYARAHLGLFMYGTMSAQGVAGGASVCLGTGTPVITSQSPAFGAMKSFPQVIMNAAALATMITEVYERPLKQGELAAMAIAYRDLYSWSEIAREHEALYKRIRES